MPSTLRKLSDLLDRRERLGWLALTPLSVGSAALEAAGAAGVLALIRLVGEPAASAGDPVVRAARRLLPELDRDAFLAAFALGLVLFYVAKNGVRLLEAWGRERCTNDSSRKIATGLLQRYLAAPYPFHMRRHSTELLRNVHEVSERVARGALQSSSALLSEALVVVGILAVVVHAMPGFALAVGSVTALLCVGLLRATQRYHTDWGRENHLLHRAALQHLQESLAGVKAVKVSQREGWAVETFDRVRADLARVGTRRGVAAVAPRIVLETLFIAGVAALVIAAASRGAAGLVPLLGLFAYAGARLLPSLHWIVYHGNEMRFAGAAVDDLHTDWMGLAEDARAAPVPRPLALEDRIALEGVTFAYPGARWPALRDVDLVIKAKSSVGVVGPTGSGKSTLLDLLLGLLRPDAGRILVDGVDIRDRIPAWQGQVGYVPQEVVLLDDTVARNVALGRHDAEIDRDRVRRALSLAQLLERVLALPRALDTPVGERGVRLSGGERQRLAVARALYADPEVLVFDEATAALDAECERALTAAIESLQRKKTLVVVAHRLPTVRGCDRIVVLREGRIVDVGAWDELAERSEDFRRLLP